MARRIITVLKDDLDGSDATETVRFAIDGICYEIDLNPHHAAELRRTLEPYQTRGRRLAPTGRPWRRIRGKDDGAVGRGWAAQNGVDCPRKGRIPAEGRRRDGAGKRGGGTF